MATFDFQAFSVVEYHRSCWAPALSAFTKATRLRSRAELLDSYATLLERGALLCVGADIGCFSRGDVAAFLRHVRNYHDSANLAIGWEDEKSRIVGNDWTEHLHRGEYFQALEISMVQTSDNPHLHGRFLSAVQLSTTTLSSPFHALLRFEDDSAWSRRLLGEVGLFVRAIQSQDTWSHFASGTTLLFDGLLQTIADLADLNEMFEGFTPDMADIPLEEMDAPGIVAVLLARILRWRFDPADPRVVSRFEELLELGEAAANTVCEKLELTGSEVWPGGFRTHAADVIERWRETTSMPIPGGVPQLA